MTAKGIESGLDPLSLEELELRRDTLALDSRHEPDLRKELTEVEDELARRRIEGDRQEAASRAEARRAEEERLKREAAERKARERAVKEATQRLGVACGKTEEALRVLVAALREARDAAGDRSNAQVALGSPPDWNRAWSAMANRVSALMSDLFPHDFGRPMDGRYWTMRLSALLGVPEPETKRRTR